MRWIQLQQWQLAMTPSGNTARFFWQPYPWKRRTYASSRGAWEVSIFEHIFLMCTLFTVNKTVFSFLTMHFRAGLDCLCKTGYISESKKIYLRQIYWSLLDSKQKPPRPWYSYRTKKRKTCYPFIHIHTQYYLHVFGSLKQQTEQSVHYTRARGVVRAHSRTNEQSNY